MARYLTNINMRTTTCSCGITWAAPTRWFKDREDDHKTFYCPNGCSRHFPQESEEERLSRQLKEKKACCLRAELAVGFMERSTVAYKGHITRLKNKVKGE